MTEAQINEELTECRAAILRITKQEEAQYSVAGRQVVREGATKLQMLYTREKELEQLLVRVQRGGIRVRWGVPV